MKCSGCSGRQIAWFASVGLVLVLLLAACQPIRVPASVTAPAGQGSGSGNGGGDGGGKGDGSGPNQTNPPAADEPVTPGAVFDVVLPDGSRIPFALDQLAALPLTSILSDGQPQEGPSLVDVLAAAGVTAYGSVTLTGVDGEVVLTAADVTPEMVLDFNNRGSVKFVSPALARDQRIRDIYRITIGE